MSVLNDHPHVYGVSIYNPMAAIVGVSKLKRPDPVQLGLNSTISFLHERLDIDYIHGPQSWPIQLFNYSCMYKLIKNHNRAFS